MEYDVEVTVNGTLHRTRVPAHFTLLRALREKLNLTGAKEGCGIGECGACSVIVNGKLVNACLMLAVEANGSTIKTIEGESNGDELSDLQQAFIDHHALQCGFCTPGMILAASELLQRNAAPTEDEVVEAIAGNVCRCTGYVTAIEAVRSVAQARAKGGAR